MLHSESEFYNFNILVLLLTGTIHQIVHGKVGYSRWNKTPVYLSVPVISQAWTAHCGDCYNPQPVNRGVHVIFETLM